MGRRNLRILCNNNCVIIIRSNKDSQSSHREDLARQSLSIFILEKYSDNHIENDFPNKLLSQIFSPKLICCNNHYWCCEFCVIIVAPSLPRPDVINIEMAHSLFHFDSFRLLLKVTRPGSTV